jgi:hypothetical protein
MDFELAFDKWENCLLKRMRFSTLFICIDAKILPVYIYKFISPPQVKLLFFNIIIKFRKANES